MRTNLTQTLLGKDAFKTRKVSCLPDYLSPTANDLMTYEQGFGITRTIYGNGYTRLSQKVTAFGAGTGTAGSGAGAGTDAGTGAMPPETLIGAEVIGKTYFQPDIYGSPLFASNEQGQVLRYAERNIWGGHKLPVHNDLNISGIEDSLRFTSYAYDPVIGKYFAQARFYDSRQGRMLSKDPVKRDINGYPYCSNDPVNCVDPTGEVANVLVGGAIGGLVGGAFGFANSAVSQLMSGKGFDSGKAWGAAANGAIVGAVKGAVAGSGVGLPLAVAADFTAGTIGSMAEQALSEGVVDAGKSIAGGLTNAVNGLIYGNDTLRSLKEAAGKGAASGALTSGINYLADVTGPQPAARRSPGIQYQGGAAGMLRPRDPKRGCTASDPTIRSLRYGRDYGYQYNVPVSGEENQNRRGFSLCDFMKEMLTGAVTGGMAGATFYGAGRAVRALKESVKGGISVDDLTIMSRNSSRGKPNAINHFDVGLNSRQNNLLSKLPNYDSSTIVNKSGVNLNDLAALTAKTGDEFAMFTRGSQRMIVRGGPTKVNIDGTMAQELYNAGFKWSGHTHPGIGVNVKMPSLGDKYILNIFKQTQGVIYDSTGKFEIFGGY